MKILIVCTDLLSQAELLATELYKLGYHSEVTQNLHPARLILNRYDVIHFVDHHYEMNLKKLLFVLTAKSLQIPILLTSYSFKKESKTLAKSLSLFDAITCSSVSDLKKIRHFSGSKIILPYIPNDQIVSKSQDNSSNLSFVLPVIKNFDDLLVFKDLPSPLNDKFFYVDATSIVNLSSKMRKSWEVFKSHNIFTQKFVLITEKLTLENILQTENCRILLNLTEIDSPGFAKWIEHSQKTNSFLVMNEQQATGFAPFWQHGKNCIISNNFKTIDQEIHPDPKLKINVIIDEKINDLARTYLKISQKKYSLLRRNQAS